MKPLRSCTLLGISGLTVAVGAFSVPQAKEPATSSPVQEAAIPQAQTVVTAVEEAEHPAPKSTPETTKKVRPMKRATSQLLAIVQQPSIKEADQVIADKALRIVLPSHCRNIIKKFFVTYNKDLKSRGYAGASTLIVQSLPDKKEEFGIFVHEASHVLDLGCLTGSPESGESAFRDGGTVMYNNDPSVEFYSISWMKENIQAVGSERSDFVTGYAASNAFEDLSESVTYYVLDHAAFTKRARTNAALAQKLAWLEKYVFSGDIRVATATTEWNGKIPWDATKLAFNWNDDTLVAMNEK